MGDIIDCYLMGSRLRNILILNTFEAHSGEIWNWKCQCWSSEKPIMNNWKYASFHTSVFWHVAFILENKQTHSGAYQIAIDYASNASLSSLSSDLPGLKDEALVDTNGYFMNPQQCNFKNLGRALPLRFLKSTYLCFQILIGALLGTYVWAD